MPTRLIRFGAVGLAATALHLGVAWGLGAATAWPLAAVNAAAYATAVGLSYLGHRFWSFQSRRPTAHSLPRFLALSAACLGASTGIAALVEAATDWPRAVALTLAAASVPPVSYLVARRAVF